MKEAIVLFVFAILRQSEGKSPDLSLIHFAILRFYQRQHTIQPSSYCFHPLMTSRSLSLSLLDTLQATDLSLLSFQLPPSPQPFGFLLAYYPSYSPWLKDLPYLAISSQSPGYLWPKAQPFGLISTQHQLSIPLSLRAQENPNILA